MKGLCSKIIITIILIFGLAQSVSAKSVVVGGQLLGLQLYDGEITVAGFAGESRGLEIGDKLIKVDGRAVHTAADVRQALDRSKGQVTLTVVRQKKQETLTVSPEITTEGPRLGLYLKEGITGVGTLTFYDPETGKYGALGHGVTQDGGLISISGGKAYGAAIVSVKKGKIGAPGQISGTPLPEIYFGTVEKNTAQGIFGTARKPMEENTAETALRSQIHTGKAQIYATVEEGGAQLYDVEIQKVYSANDNRDMLIKVTDSRLLRLTGGIVQGMSGSPIVQDGLLVGAVTHVLIGDPTTGYGIFIDRMLQEAA